MSISHPQVSRPWFPWVPLLAAVFVLAGCAVAPQAGEAPGRGPEEGLGQSASAICSSASLAPSPATAGPGATVTWTATAGCDAGDTPEYDFWMQPPGGSWSQVQAYGPSATYTWDTTGLATGVYDFEVGIRAQGSSSSFESYYGYNFVLDGTAACTGGALSFSPVSPAAVGTLVTVAGSAACGGTPEYEFYMQPPGGSWSQVQAYGPSSTFAWDTTGLAAGTYDFEVGVRNQGSGASFETYKDVTFTLGSSSSSSSSSSSTSSSSSGTFVSPCANGALETFPVGSAPVGKLVILDASATCGGTAEYEYYMQALGGAWTLVQPYGKSSIFDWDTTGLSGGTYGFQVGVRNQGSTASYETYAGTNYTLTSSAACTSAGLVFTPLGTAPIGATVTVTGSATCGSAGEYEFLMQPPGGSWTTVQAYGPSTTYAWNTTGLAVGAYEFEVRARSQGSTATYESYIDASYPIYDATACTANGTLKVSPPGPFTPQGTTVTATATAATCPAPEYEFWVQVPGATMLQLGQAYSPSNTFAWNTTGLPNGNYAIQVWMRNQGSTAQSQAIVNHTYQLGVPCSAITMSLSTLTAVPQGTQVTVTGQATCPSTPEYDFGVGVYAGETNYSASQSYSPSNTWVWDTTQAPAGKYSIGAGARIVGSTFDPEVSVSNPAFYVYTTETDCTNNVFYVVSPLNANNTVTIGSPLTLQSVANCYAEYEFYVRPQGSLTYFLAQPYGSPNGGTFVWDTTGQQPGGVSIEVGVRKAGTSVSFELYNFLTPGVTLVP
jgi:hypothetical protein